jgi:hypothetical protein
MNIEQEILNAFERGKGFGIAEGMKMMRLKELTDEEIVGIRMTTEGDIKAFARAILRKAQEK